MSKLWGQVAELAELLVYMTKTMDPDGVEFNGAVEHLVIGGVGVDTLWGGGQVVFLFTS